MSVGIEHDPYIVLWLHRCEPGSGLDGVCNGGVKIGNGDVQVFDRALAVRLAGPGRFGPLRLVLEAERHLTHGPDLRPTCRFRLARSRPVRRGHGAVEQA